MHVRAELVLQPEVGEARRVGAAAEPEHAERDARGERVRLAALEQLVGGRPADLAQEHLGHQPVGGALVEHADAEERGGLHDRGHLELELGEGGRVQRGDV